VTSAGKTFGRIGPVYTPPEFRRQGFGAAVTAAMSQRLTTLGCNVVLLYADIANPTSNAMYERLGFEPVAEIVEYVKV
jgi:predicted GNAT family acetyltransferase